MRFCRQLRQSEIEDLGLSPVRHKDIGWLNVTMDNSATVSSVQGVGDSHGDSQQWIKVEGLTIDLARECCALQQLHCNEGLTGRVLDVIYRADVGMIQRRSSACLTLESFQGLMVSRSRVRQEL